MILVNPNNATLEFPNERGIEIECLKAAVCRVISDSLIYNWHISSILDVGACYSHAHYAKLVRGLLPRAKYSGLDIIPDPETEAIVDQYVTRNVLEFNRPHDIVISISTIEHCGITSYKVSDPADERKAVTRKILSLANRAVFITFPFGLLGEIPGQMANITLEDVNVMKQECNKNNIETWCFHHPAPWEKTPWLKLNIIEASKISVNTKDNVVHCVCAFFAWDEK